MSSQNKDLLKCGICFKHYDSIEHKPKSLPCQHFFCTSCIDKFISTESTLCPECSAPIHETEVKQQSLTVSFTVSSPVLKEDFSAGFCPDHSNCKLYFKCKIHNVKVCRDCTVIAHTPGVCELISLKDELKERISNLQEQFSNQMATSDNMKVILQMNIHCAKEENKVSNQELLNLKQSITHKQDDIGRTDASILEYNKAVKEIQEKQQEIGDTINQLTQANTATGMHIASEKARTMSSECTKFQSKLDEDFSDLIKKDLPKCGVCFAQYNTSERMAMFLPCHHFFCIMCIDKMLTSLNNHCPVCRVPIGVTSASLLSTNSDLKVMLQSLNGSSHVALTITPPVLDKAFSEGFCSDHDTSKLYFKCKSHNISICRDCSVVAHQPGLCRLISLKDEVKEILKLQQHGLSIHTAYLDNAETVLKGNVNCLSEQNKKINQELNQLEDMVNKKMEDIARAEVNILKYSNAIKNIQERLPQIETIRSHLKMANTATVMHTTSERAELISSEWKKFRCKIEEDFSHIITLKVELLMNIVQHSSNMILIEEDENSSNPISVVTLKDKQLCLPATSKMITADANAYKYKISYIKHLITDSEVYITLFKESKTIGTVYIKPIHHEYGKIFVDLAMGRFGCTLIERTSYLPMFNLWRTMHNVSESCRCPQVPHDKAEAEALAPAGVYYTGSGILLLCPSNFNSDGQHVRIGTVIRGMNVVDRACSHGVAIKDAGLILLNPK